jgi:predicted porin
VLGAYLKLKGGTKLAVGWLARDNMGSTTPKSNMYWVGSIVPLGGPWFVDGLLAQLKYENSANKASLLNLRGRYVLTKETTLYATVAYMDNSGTLALPATASTPCRYPWPGQPDERHRRRPLQVLSGLDQAASQNN